MCLCRACGPWCLSPCARQVQCTASLRHGVCPTPAGFCSARVLRAFSSPVLHVSICCIALARATPAALCVFPLARIKCCTASLRHGVCPTHPASLCSARLLRAFFSSVEPLTALQNTCPCGAMSLCHGRSVLASSARFSVPVLYHSLRCIVLARAAPQSGPVRTRLICLNVPRARARVCACALATRGRARSR